jgi:S-formylglutathione hydrolase FrmB
MRLVLALALSACAYAAPLRFQITLDPSVAPHGSSGRLLVFLADASKPRDVLNGGFVPGETWIAAKEVEFFAAGSTIDFDADIVAYPKPFSQAAPGDYEFMALLDPDHSYARSAQDGGDLYSAVVTVRRVNPADTAPVKLVITKLTPTRPKPVDTESIKLVEFVSPMLSKFWGRPITMQAGVVLPPDYAKNTAKKYPAVYVVHGFGGDHTTAWRSGPGIGKDIGEGKLFPMVHIFLNASFSTGHHVFADSVNNGPWGKALTEELIPHLEKRFRLIPKTSARFLTGHSSGGWSTMWLEVNYPDVFGGTWSTSPDPVDLHSFTGIDVTPGSKQNAYQNKSGGPLNLVRMNGKEVASFEQFAKAEEVQGEYGGQIASFEWVWSPKGPGGRPMKEFNRVTGEQDPFVQEAWQKYDIRKIVERNWPTLGPKLLGKLHLVVGSEDTFHLEEAAIMLCDFLKTKGREDVCEVVPGRDHMNLYQKYKTYPDGLAVRIDREMRASFERAGK